MPTWRGPYSSDDDFDNFTQNMSRDASYPGPKPNVYVEGPPCKGIDKDGVPYGAIDCSKTIDPQQPYGYTFDDQRENKSGTNDWSATKSDDGLGGFPGDTLPRFRANNHPTRSSLNARGKAGPQVGGRNK